MELDEPSFEFKPAREDRPRMPEPLPVKVVAIADVRLPMPPNVEHQLDAFYVGLLGFERMPGDEYHLFYRSESFDLIFQQHNRPVEHDKLTATIIEVPSQRRLQQQLIDLEYEFEIQRGLTPGQDPIVLRDPAGNFLSLIERREVR